MKYFEYGKQNPITIMLLPGTFCRFGENFSKVIPLLEDRFHVIGVDYDGFDGEDTDFSDMMTVTRKIENYITEQFNGKINIVYGSSLGGSFVGLLVQREKVHFDHAILGSSDLDQSTVLSAKLKVALFGDILYKMLKSGKMSDRMMKRTKQKLGEEGAQRYLEMINSIFASVRDVSKESMMNEFYSDLITPLNENISVPGTKVHIFYALKMGEKYRQRYFKHFKDPDIREQDYRHEELLFSYPKEWFNELICSITENNKA